MPPAATPPSKTTAVIGAGPAGLMAAEVLARGGVAVTVYDRMPSAGRKLLMAGRGGLNLTHSEDLTAFLARYRGGGDRLRRAVEAFPPSALRAWADELGQETFTGSSGRVFPKAMKASPLLRAWLRRLNDLGVRFEFRHHWRGFDDAGRLRFTQNPNNDGDDDVTVAADATVLALGGASWPRLGSDGGWADILSECGVGIAPLAASNCGFAVPWSEPFRRFAGEPLKRIALTFGSVTARGEAVVTRDGLEGGAVYALSPLLREAIAAQGDATLIIDLRPDMSSDAIAEKLSAPRDKQSLSNVLRKALKLSPAAAGLLHEAAASAGKALSAYDAAALAALIKSVPVRLTAPKPIATAISSAGGVRFDALDDAFMLKELPGVFAAGEMLDWEAPTGGYLLQACFATGAAAGQGATDWLQQSGTRP
ncbi:NAD(P)/FAD-dependent oxidoreductase [Pseudolabrys sp.]|uniref:NAD(P)/FAD-dependent oxidoreductase n=1 Tax=Pseudolabrys sp. TaxID=1960880 RepID=UPI003D0F3D6B